MSYLGGKFKWFWTLQSFMSANRAAQLIKLQSKCLYGHTAIAVFDLKKGT